MAAAPELYDALRELISHTSARDPSFVYGPPAHFHSADAILRAEGRV
jgi:hypothetical protein